MRENLFTCDGCGRKTTQPGGVGWPVSWLPFTIYSNTMRVNDDLHACSQECAGKAVAKAAEEFFPKGVR